jgi:DNA-binding MarR family transcriptional regulator
MDGIGASLLVMQAADTVPAAELRPWRTVHADGALEADLAARRPDLLLLSADRVTPGLAGRLAEPDLAAMPLVLLAGDSDAEAVGLLLERPFILVDAPPAAGAAALALRQAAGALSHGVADAGSRPAADSRLEALKRDAERVAAALAELAGTRSDDPARAVTAGRIRAQIKARRARDRFFDASLFADPVWDILLDLAASRLEERPVSVSSLCIAASVPTTTALRTIKMMVDHGLLVRRSDPADARRTFIAMGPATARTMEACLDTVLNTAGL